MKFTHLKSGYNPVWFFSSESSFLSQALDLSHAKFFDATTLVRGVCLFVLNQISPTHFSPHGVLSCLFFSLRSFPSSTTLFSDELSHFAFLQFLSVTDDAQTTILFPQKLNLPPSAYPVVEEDRETPSKKKKAKGEKDSGKSSQQVPP